jgi:hypothetical protein
MLAYRRQQHRRVRCRSPRQRLADARTIVALAQASMAGAAERVTRGATPLTSPQTGLVAAIDAATRAAQAQAQK